MTLTNKAKLEALLQLINSAAREAIAEYEKTGDDVPFIDSTGPHPLDDALDQVALKSALRTLEGACAQLCTSLAPPSHTANNLVQVYDHACVRVAIRENITDILMDYPNGIHVDELSKIVNIEAQKLVRVLRLLATRGCYNEVEADIFANNRLSLVLHSKNPIRHIVSLRVETYVKGSIMLYETLKDPKTALSDDPDHSPLMYANNKEGFVGGFYDWIKHQDIQRESYNLSMRAVNKITGSLAVVNRFPFEKYSTVVDVGGGIGAFALPLIKTHKHIKLTLQDLPDTLVQTRSVWAKEYPEAMEENRVEFVDLDFFLQIPVQGKDIYYLSNIVHNWPDHTATVILRNVHKALGPHSRVLINEHVLRGLSRKQVEAEAASLGTAVAPEPMLANFGVGNIRMYEKDISMWIMFNAKERTLQNTLKLSDAAGLKLERVWDLVETCVLEFSAV